MHQHINRANRYICPWYILLKVWLLSVLNEIIHLWTWPISIILRKPFGFKMSTINGSFSEMKLWKHRSFSRVLKYWTERILIIWNLHQYRNLLTSSLHNKTCYIVERKLVCISNFFFFFPFKIEFQDQCNLIKFPQSQNFVLFDFSYRDLDYFFKVKFHDNLLTCGQCWNSKQIQLRFRKVFSSPSLYYRLKACSEKFHKLTRKGQPAHKRKAIWSNYIYIYIYRK